jgi:carboxyl-terminal processing protease
LPGAFKNPGPLGGAGAANAERATASATYSPPIREQLIGTAEDAQLKAALAHFGST